MNQLKRYLILSSLFAVGGCSLGASWPQQITSLNVDCNADTVHIINQEVDLNGEESWTAICEDKTYYCTYFPTSDSDCYEVDK